MTPCAHRRVPNRDQLRPKTLAFRAGQPKKSTGARKEVGATKPETVTKDGEREQLESLHRAPENTAADFKQS